MPVMANIITMHNKTVLKNNSATPHHRATTGSKPAALLKESAVKSASYTKQH